LWMSPQRKVHRNDSAMFNLDAATNASRYALVLKSARSNFLTLEKMMNSRRAAHEMRRNTFTRLLSTIAFTPRTAYCTTGESVFCNTYILMSPNDTGTIKDSGTILA